MVWMRHLKTITTPKAFETFEGRQSTSGWYSLHRGWSLGVGTRKPGAKEYWYIEKFEPTRHVIEVEIKDNVRTYRAINHDKKVFDHFVDKRDADKNNK